MHILYVEEAGTPREPSAARNRYFVIGGLIIPDLAWHDMQDALGILKERLELQGELKWKYFSARNREAGNPMRSMSPSQRIDILSEIYGFIASLRPVKAIASVALVQAAYLLPSIHDWKDLFHHTYKPVTERFQYFLQDQSRKEARRETGIIISGRREALYMETLSEAHSRLLQKGACRARYDHLIESVLFEPSQASAGVQLAGLVAGAVWSMYEKGENQWYQMIEPVFRRSADGVIAGFGIVEFPKPVGGGTNRRGLKFP